MIHHFADLLDRTADYWTIIPSNQIFAFSSDDEIKDKGQVKALTISKNHKSWRQIFDCPNIEEVTLYNPDQDQIREIQKLTQLKRLRLSTFRAKDIEFIRNLPNLEEVAFEYVSGFSDLSPFQSLNKIKSMYFENLRRVSNFDGLIGLNSLRFLYIQGTLDWNQPIENFSFLAGLPNVEVLCFGWVINKSDFPAFLPAMKMKSLQRIRIGMATFHAKEYAFLETALPHVKCGNFGDNPWTPCYQIENAYTEFLGKGSGRVKRNNPDLKAKIQAFENQYAAYKLESAHLIKNNT